MSVDAGQARIKRASRELFARWHSTRSMWRDEVSSKFEDKHLTPLVAALRTAEEALGRMAMVLQRLHQDCE